METCLSCKLEKISVPQSQAWRPQYRHCWSAFWSRNRCSALQENCCHAFSRPRISSPCNDPFVQLHCSHPPVCRCGAARLPAWRICCRSRYQNNDTSDEKQKLSKFVSNCGNLYLYSVSRWSEMVSAQAISPLTNFNCGSTQLQQTCSIKAYLFGIGNRVEKLFGDQFVKSAAKVETDESSSWQKYNCRRVVLSLNSPFGQSRKSCIQIGGNCALKPRRIGILLEKTVCLQQVVSYSPLQGSMPRKIGSTSAFSYSRTGISFAVKLNWIGLWPNQSVSLKFWTALTAVQGNMQRKIGKLCEHGARRIGSSSQAVFRMIYSKQFKRIYNLLSAN